MFEQVRPRVFWPEWDPEQYELIDFGQGRRLERFGEIVLDRPCEVADKLACALPEEWHSADAKFVRLSAVSGQKIGDWVTILPGLPERWLIRWRQLVLELKRTNFGHVGLFAEHTAHWPWLIERISGVGKPCRVLHLFAYTGGTTLAMAASGAEVAHVDSAENVVRWAKRNAELSRLASAPIRWICEDALRFAKRELRREAHYDAVVLDPPSYGHGPRGEVWRIKSDLDELLHLCFRLTGEGLQFLLLTVHTPKYTPKKLGHLVEKAFPFIRNDEIECGSMCLVSRSGRLLPSGICARWSRAGIL